MSRLARISLPLTVIFIIQIATNLAAASQRYRIEMIGQAPTYDPLQHVKYVGGLNNRGEVVYSYGRSIQVTPTYHRSVSDSYLATRTGIMPIPNLSGDDAMANDVTDSGLVVGGGFSADTYETRTGEWYYYDAFGSHGGRTITIPTPERGYASASAANNSGEVIGYAWSSQNGQSVFKWSEFGGYEDLGDFGAYYLDAVDINERGDILVNVTPEEILQYGDSYSYRGPKPIIYNGGSITRVPDSEFKITHGSAINDIGVVVGSFASIPGVEGHAYVWDPTNGFRDLEWKASIATQLTLTMLAS